MRYGQAGHQVPRDTDEQPDASQGAPGHDRTLLALEELVAAAEDVARMTAHVTARAARIRSRRMEGLPYRQIVADEDLPLIAALLTENIQRLEAAGTRFRQAEAHALHDEGMTMEEIGRLFGLTRQRISTLIRAASAPAPDQGSDQDGSPPTTATAPELSDEWGGSGR
jgi:hypothetical protein